MYLSLRTETEETKGRLKVIHRTNKQTSPYIQIKITKKNVIQKIITHQTNELERMKTLKKGAIQC